ncbi:acyl-CoA/acyl-ACP dehydrogenase [Mycobacterium sp. CVI_P3]|uniref:Acyl-CoA/acyl-ACP dehydrogenase n=1 Tax=Mycobacterium pinniadriaticum TaxID=2994102 RepID=A0ABT3SF74_9MYCO|nr:acyl-CoA dehydrogenase family protein [Mycobacterium pinniadriaticum]MCX2931765.1 acyl-CoA/acyl-ACP dehydrogenase [Mycobacterium pinniadriaticum]MCX2938160.1 acyl-CoA/acyl-ACP dehydrogenase [Mycobacterium pinniadriaticum]
MEDRTLRNEDFSLDDEQVALREAFGAFFTKECQTTVVRAAEPHGFDPELWGRLMGLGVTTMGIPEARGGDGAGLVELALAAEEYGRALAPVPMIETIVAARVLAGASNDAQPWLHDQISGERIISVALQRATDSQRQLVPAGAISDAIIALHDQSLVLIADSGAHPQVANQACAPLAWWTPADEHEVGLVIAEGSEAETLWQRALLEWKLLTAAALVGLSDAVLSQAVGYARARHAFGVPIGSFQAVSHPLVDVHIGVQGARRLAWKAAWFAENEPQQADRLALMAWVHAADVATHAAATCLHTHGGVAFTTESDIQLFFRRAKGWATIAGDPRRELQNLADVLLRQMVRNPDVKERLR